MPKILAGHGTCVRFLSLSMLLSVLVLIGVPGPGIEVVDAQLANPPAPRFGVIGALDTADLDQLGVGWVQISFEWRAFQPDGPDDWSDDAVDVAYLTAVAQSDREIVGVITGTPAWASLSESPSAVPDGLMLPLDDPGNTWAAFVTRLVATYRQHGVHHWVIYDEPNVRLGEGRVGFAGDVSDYARLLGVAYRAAHQGDRQAVVHLAALNWWVDDAAGRQPYLARLLDVLMADPDAANNHYYFDVATVRVTDNTAMVGSTLADTRVILEQAEIGYFPIWLETGVGGGDTVFDVSPEQVADLVNQAAVLGLVEGAARIGVAGLATSSGVPWLPAKLKHPTAPSPAFTMYQHVIDQLSSANGAQRHTYLSAELIFLTQAEQDVYIIWTYGDQPVYVEITSGTEGETGTRFTRADGWQTVESQLIDWPAVFAFEMPASQPDANGFLTIAGSPVWLILERDEAFVRVVYALVGGEWARLK